MNRAEKSQMCEAANRLALLEKEREELRGKLKRQDAVLAKVNAEAFRLAKLVSRLEAEQTFTRGANEGYKEALEFYADKHTWEPMRNGEEEPIWNDYGDTACTALGLPCLQRPDRMTTEGDYQALNEQVNNLDGMLNIFG